MTATPDRLSIGRSTKITAKVGDFFLGDEVHITYSSDMAEGESLTDLRFRIGKQVDEIHDSEVNLIKSKIKDALQRQKGMQ